MTGREPEIYVNRVQSAGPISEEDVVRAVRAVAQAEGMTSGEISITFVDAAAIAVLNETHLERSGSTDVIAFNLAEPGQPLGDVYICPEVAARSAQEWGVELREELLRLVIHGILHVAGHDHPEGEERLESEMFRRQEAILAAVI
ncbi:MAG: rRNA maturation RNase YbeY [Gemmatimonadales bacterium]